MLKNSMNWVLEKAGQGLMWFVGVTADGIGYTALQLEPVFVIVAMIGVFLILFGQKRLGTKLTSSSILIYTLARIIL